MKRFDDILIEKQIRALSEKGYNILKIRSDEKGWYYKIQDPKDALNDCGVGIGYNTNEMKGDYFYHNTHGNNDSHLNNVWNHSNKSGPAPAGWYSFDQTYIENLIKKLGEKVF
jgi:hypothetical protein